MITRVKLQRFKKFNDNEVILKPFSVLMGENNISKDDLFRSHGDTGYFTRNTKDIKKSTI